MKKLKIILLAAFSVLVLSGPLQHIGAIPQTAVGSASKAVLKSVKDTLFPPAFAACGVGEGFGSLASGDTGFSGTLFSGGGGGTAGNGGTALAALPSGSGNGGAAAKGSVASAGGGAAWTGAHGATGFFGGASGGFGFGAVAGAGGGGSAGPGMEVMVVSPGNGPAPFREPEILKPRALLVDAHEDARESNRVLLQLDGYAVMTAANARQGLESFDWFLPNVVLVDRDLPGDEITEFARNVRKAKVGSSAVLVALSDQAEQERHNILAAGFDGILAKPLKLEDLRQVIELIARRSTRTQTASSEADRPARLTLNTAGRSYAESAPAGGR